jgi:hypothetical protein
MRLRKSGRQHEVQGDAAETRAGGPLEERGPGPRTPVRKLVLMMLGLAVVVVAFISSYASALGKPGPRHVPVAVRAPPACSASWTRPRSLGCTRFQASPRRG